LSTKLFREDLLGGLLSTVKLDGYDRFAYETIFFDRDGEAMISERADSLDDAIAMHVRVKAEAIAEGL
jgi:hypothetical protein